MSTDCKNVEVELRPFKHQVGGHTCVLEICEKAICKPFITKEAWFYNHVPDTLREFIPTHLGETYVTCDIQNDRKCLVASVPENLVRAECKGCVTKDDVPTVSPFQPRRKRRRSNKQNDKSEKGNALEAWSSTCIDRQINRYGFWANNQPQRFLMLENLVYNYNRPCMMDLKMGRRQYGEDSCAEKRKLLESRCAHTTSVTLGFRICGSQVYDVTAGEYICHNKYFGRNLDDNGVYQELTSFFHDGQRVRVDAIRGVLKKVEDLKVAMETQKKFNFHSASLLLMYDALTTRQPDFEVNEKCNELKIAKSLDENRINQAGHSKQSQLAESGQNESDCMDNDVSNIQPCVTDIRLIDFAHVSEIKTDEKEDFSEETIRFGLDNLEVILNTILDNC